MRSVACFSGQEGTILDWPQAEPGDNLDYLVDLWPLLGGMGDTLLSMSVSVRPSGAGELVVGLIAVVGYQAVVWLSGGVAGRTYIVKIALGTVLGRSAVLLVNLPIDPALEELPVPVPPDWGFGPPTSWTSGVTVFGPVILAVQEGVTATGTNQATAYALAAQTTEVISCPAGAGVGLNPNVVAGTLTVQNDDPANTLNVYPPPGAQIQFGGTLLAVNAPFVMGANGARINFSTEDAGSLWVAG